MKFLGLRLCEHDSNITFTDGTTVKYYSSERDIQIKHHGFGDLSSWKRFLILLMYLLKILMLLE